MRILRSLSRRGFNVGTAGYFNVLRQNTWFAASRLSDGFESLAGRSDWSRPKGPARPETAENPVESAALPPALALLPHQFQPMRAAIIVCAAIALTMALLWWIMHPGTPWHL
jgi:hypothetical protein